MLKDDAQLQDCILRGSREGFLARLTSIEGAVPLSESEMNDILHYVDIRKKVMDNVKAQLSHFPRDFVQGSRELETGREAFSSFRSIAVMEKEWRSSDYAQTVSELKKMSNLLVHRHGDKAKEILGPL